MNLPNPEEFIYRDCQIGGDDCTLIFPSHIGATWTKDNLHFRSIILRKSDHKVLSIGHLKFFNHTEKPDLYPEPTQFNDWRISTKLDGSLICVSRYKGELIIRTRGTSTIDVYETGPEVRALLAQYPTLNGEGPDGALVKDVLYSNTLLFEHTTPSNIIVVPYETPTLTLLDVVAHEDCQYWSAKQVDQLALCIGCPRPETHSFGSLDDIVETLKNLEGIEGYVLAYNNNRNRVKLKGLSYLTKHRFKERATLPNILDIWFQNGRPDIDTFKVSLERDYDHECLTMALPFCDQIHTAYQSVQSKISTVRETVGWRLFEGEQAIRYFNGEVPTRRDYALAIQARWSDLYRGVAFGCLDNKEVDDKTMRKLIEAELSI